MKTITSELEDYVRKARAKHPLQSHRNGTSRDFYGPLARIAQQKTDLATQNNMLLWVDVLKEEMYEVFAEEDPLEIRRELLEAGAVIINWVKDIDAKLEVQRALDNRGKADRADHEGAGVGTGGQEPRPAGLHPGREVPAASA
jgi:hypothetical protein